jgi:hypothetical protein
MMKTKPNPNPAERAVRRGGKTPGITRRRPLSTFSILLSLGFVFATFGAQPETPIPLAPSLACDGAYRVLIVYSDFGAPPATLKANLLAEPGISQVDMFDGGTGTPGGFQ